MVNVFHYIFNGPWSLNTNFFNIPSVYVVYANDLCLEVGETEKLGQRLNNNNHERKNLWFEKAKKQLVKVVFLRIKKKQDRLEIKKQLRLKLSPIFGEK